MSDAVQFALLASLAPTIASVIVGIITFRNSRKTDTVILKTEEIHTLTNSRMSEMVKSLAVAMEKIDGLQQVIANMKEANSASALAEAKKP